MVDLCEKCGHRAVCRFREHYEECLQFIEDVVRCKECKEIAFCRIREVGYFTEDGYCQYGERRTDG